MSLITDLLSKINREYPKRDIPPVFRDSILQETAKRNARKRLAVCAAVLSLVVSGFGAFLLWGSKVLSPVHAPKVEQASPAVQPASSVVVPSLPPPLDVAQPAQPRVALKGVRTAVKPKPISRPVHHARRTAHQEIPKRPTAPLPFASLQPTEQKEPDTDDLKPSAESKTKISVRDDKDFYLYAARTSELHKNYRQALANYNKVIEIEPDNFIVMNNIACAMINLGAYEEAIEYARAALNIKKDHVASLINLGVAYGRLGQHQEGEGYFLRALSVEPGNRVALLNLGIICEKAGDLDKAGGYFATLSETRDAEGYLGLARIAEKQQRTTDAIIFYKTAISLATAGSEPWKLANERLMQLTR